MTLPPEIQFEQLPDGIRYTLPKRNLGAWRFLGLVPFGFGCLFGGFAVFWTVMATGLFQGDFHWGRLLFGAFGIPFILGGLGIMHQGLTMLLPGRCFLTIQSKHILHADTSGILRRTRRLPTEGLQEITVEHRKTAPGANAPALSSAALGSHLTLRYTNKNPVPFAQGYDAEILTPLAHAIASHLQLPSAEQTLRATAANTPIRVTEVVEPVGAKAARLTIDRPTQPPESKIQLAEYPDSLIFMLPRRGYFSGTIVLLFFALVWLAISSCVTGGFTVALIRERQWPMIFPVLFGGAFILIGLFLLGYYIHNATATAVLVASNSAITFTQKSRLRKTEWQLDRKDITDIVVGPSGTEVNEQPILELQLLQGDKKQKGLLADRDTNELHWLATRLRTFYSLNQTPPPPPA